MDQNKGELTSWFFGGVLFLIGVFVIVGLVIVNSQADDVDTETTIANSAPELTGFTYSTAGAYGADLGGTLTPTAATATDTPNVTRIYAYGTVTDNNSCYEVTSGQALTDLQFSLCLDADGDALCDATGTDYCDLGDADPDDCYYTNLAGAGSGACSFDDTTDACTDVIGDGSDTSVQVSCYVDVNNYMEATDTGIGQWIGKIRLTDSQGGDLYHDPASFADTVVDSASVVSAVFCDGAPENTLDFGAIGAGDKYAENNSSGLACTVACTGNIACDTQLVASAMTCDGFGSIPSTNVAATLTNAAVHSSFTALDLSQDFELTDDADGDNVPSSATGGTTEDILYFSVDVPTTGVQGTCTGTVTFTAVDNTLF